MNAEVLRQHDQLTSCMGGYGLFCKLCGKQFTRPENCQKHISRGCSNSSQSSSSDIGSVSEVEEVPSCGFECKTCGKQLSTFRGLKDHVLGQKCPKYALKRISRNLPSQTVELSGLQDGSSPVPGLDVKTGLGRCLNQESGTCSKDPSKNALIPDSVIGQSGDQKPIAGHPDSYPHADFQQGPLNQTINIHANSINVYNNPKIENMQSTVNNITQQVNAIASDNAQINVQTNDTRSSNCVSDEPKPMVLRGLGSEDLSVLTEEKALEILRSGAFAYQNILKLVHSQDCNKNFYLGSKRDRTVQYFNTHGSVVTGDMNSVLLDIVYSNIDRLDMMYDDYGEKLTQQHKRTFQRIMDKHDYGGKDDDYRRQTYLFMLDHSKDHRKHVADYLKQMKATNTINAKSAKS